ncbi:MAG TPA: RHS repeat-associated core domain-containing protein, partial [Bacteroidia bacterium]|nr:RHS repeat-associated core domain-containing protein [Bacteroidia bacterium]
IDDQGTFTQKNESTYNYDYDEIGNLVKDKQEKITGIEWNVYGKIRSIHKVDGTTNTDITFKYDAQGNRISKRVEVQVPLHPSQPATTYYIRDASGNVMATYEIKYPADAPSLFLTEHHIYGSSRLGIANEFGFDPDTLPIRQLGTKRYELSNHLGNVLDIVSDKKIGHINSGSIDYWNADVRNANDYYTFGSPMPNRNFEAGGSDYRYGFNGQEKDDEVVGNGNQLDYGARVYDPRLGRFLSIDPLSAKYPMLSTYQFASNSPISGVDLDGLEYYYAANGTFLGKIGTSTEVKVTNDQDAKDVQFAISVVGMNGASKEGVEYFTAKANRLSTDLGIDNETLTAFASVVHNESGGKKE